MIPSAGVFHGDCRSSLHAMLVNFERYATNNEIALEITLLTFVKTSTRWNAELKLAAVVETSLVARLQRVSVPKRQKLIDY